MSCPATEEHVALMRALLERMNTAQLERALDVVVRLYAAAASSPVAPAPPPAPPRRTRRGNVLPFRARVAGEVR